MDEWDKALVAYESALRHNPNSPKALHALGRLLLEREQFGPAVEVLQRLFGLGIAENREEVLAEIGLCWLGMDELGKCALFVQKASETDGVDKDEKTGQASHSPTLWYALGLYHDRLGNEEAALDAYLAFIESERAESAEVSDRAREVYYRLGVVYRLTGKLKEARECFDFVRRQLTVCGRPTAAAQNQIAGPCQLEVLMQLALIDEVEGEVKRARSVLEKLLGEATSTNNSLAAIFRVRNLVPKLRQKLGCLALTLPTVFENDSSALALLLKATEEDPQDALNWYFLGRLYLQLRQPTKAYDAYQQAVYRDGRNAAFWNSIGLLYFNIGQFRDSLDAFTRAVHHAPQSTILWWNLGLLYESCHGSGSEDSKEAFQKGRDYSHTRKETPMLEKFEMKLQDGSSSTASTDVPLEMDANRFVTRQIGIFPRPQSAASMSRFLTYRGQQAQASQIRRPPSNTTGYQQQGYSGGQYGRPSSASQLTGYPRGVPSNANANAIRPPIYGQHPAQNYR